MWAKMIDNQKGVTLIELLVAGLISLIAFAAVYQMYTSSTKTTAVEEDVADMQQNVRVAMDQITRELRLAGYDPNNPGMGNEAIMGEVAAGSTLKGQTLTLTAGADSFSFKGDIDDDGVVETVKYELQDDSDPNYPWLMRTVQKGSGTPVTAKFAENIVGATFTFYDTHDNLTDQKDEVRRVTVSLTGRTAHEDPDFKYNGDPTDHYRKRTLTSDVVLRNSGSQSDTTPPACPTNVVIDNNTNQCRIINVTWTVAPDTDGDLAGYYIFYSTSPIPAGTDPATLNAPFVVVNGKSKVSDNVLVPDTSNYYFAMTSFDEAGNLCTPVVLSTPTDLPPGANAPPDAPSNPTATPADNQVTVEWGAVTNDDDIAGYRLYRNTTNDFSSATLIADQDVLKQQRTTTGLSSTTQYVDNAANTPAPNGGPNNCTEYFYWITTVDACNGGTEPPAAGSMSSAVAVQSLHPSTGLGPGVTPPDNSKSPPTPTITSLVAGDDTSTIIVDWSVPAPSSSQSDPDTVTILWRPQGESDWLLTNPNVGHVTYSLSGFSSWPATGEEDINGLLANTVYEVIVRTEDDAAACNDTSTSSMQSISTAECAPRYRGWDSDPNLLGNKIMPGINSVGTPINLYDTIGSDPTITPSANQNQYVTWAVDPVDCTPTSANFDTQGFDYTNPPAYDQVAKDAQVQFYIDPVGGVGTTSAAVAYGTGTSGVNTGNTTYPANSGDNIDHAPRSADGFFHFPVYPLDASHIDTTAFCDGDYEFKTIIQDGELYTATNTIPLTIKNGGIGLDGTVAVLSDINTRADIHHIVKFGIENTSGSRDFQINNLTLTWNKLSALLEAVVVKDDTDSVIGRWDYLTGTPAGRQGIGTQVTFSPAPVLGGGKKGSVTLYFSKAGGALDSTVDMRDGKVSILELEREDTVSGNACTIEPTGGDGDVIIPNDPEIDPGNTFQDQPTAAFVPTSTVGKTSAVLAPVPAFVNVRAKLLRVPTVSLDMTKTKLRVRTTADARSLSPPRPDSVLGSTGGDGIIWGSYDLTYDSGTNTLTGSIPTSGTIPASGQGLLDRQLWYYFEVVDTDGNSDILPDNNSLSYEDAYTYTTCTGLAYSIGVTTPASGSSQTGSTAATVSVSGTPYAMASVTFHVNGKGNIPDQSIAMTKTSADGVLPQTWTATYSAGSSYLAHSVYATGEDVCGRIITSLINDIN